MHNSNNLRIRVNAIVTNQMIMAIFALILGVIAIGFVAILVRLSSMGPYAIGFWRLTLALPLLIAISFLPGCKSPLPFSLEQRLFWKDYLPVIIAGILFGIDLAVWHLSIEYTSIANATVLSNLSPVIVGLFGWLVLKHPVNLKMIIGLMIAFLGIFILFNPCFTANDLSMWGNIYGIVTALIYAVYLLLIIQIRKKMDTMKIMIAVSISGAVTLWLLSYLLHHSLLITSLNEFTILFCMALLSQVIGQSLITYAFAHLPPVFTASVLLIGPIISMIAAWILFSEALSLLQMVAIAIALLGVYLTKSMV